MPRIHLVARQLGGDDPTIPQRILDAVDDRHVKRIVEPDELLEDWVEAVRAQLESRGIRAHSLSSFQIAAHGTSGFIGLGTGLVFGDVWRLYPIAHYVAPSQFPRRAVVLNGCNVASTSVAPERFLGGQATGFVHGDMCDGWASVPVVASEGYHLLHNFARLFHGAASAGIDSQPAGLQWDLRGPTLTVRADGTYQLFGFDMNECVSRSLLGH
jgi:hypothetical protein